MPTMSSMPMQTIGFFRALKIGDMLCAVPALRALRAGFPQAHIAFIGLPWARDFAKRFRHYIDSFIEFPGLPGLPEQLPDLRRLPFFIRQMRDRQFDLVVQAHGDGSIVNDFLALWNAQSFAGFYPPDGSTPFSPGLIPYPNQWLEIRRLLHLTTSMGCPIVSEHLEFPLTSWEIDQAQSLCDSKQDLVLIHPGASVAERRWFPERFIEVGRSLARQGYDIAITGSVDEQELAQRIALEIPLAHSWAGQLDLGVMGALVERAQLVISNDTSVSHLAAAFQTPSVILSTADNPARWAPIDRDRHRVLSDFHDVCPQEVLHHAKSLLRRFGDSRPSGSIRHRQPVSNILSRQGG